jgi:hypothetical protein
MGYSKVERRSWNDEKVRCLRRDTREVWFYLLTSPHMEGPGGRLGAYVLDPMYAAADLSCSDDRWTPERVERELAELDGAGRIAWDPTARLVLLVNFFRHNQPANPNVVEAAALAVTEIPASRTVLERLRQSSMELLPAAFNSGKPLRGPIVDAVDRCLGNLPLDNALNRSESVTPTVAPTDTPTSPQPEQEQEQEQEQERRGPDGPSSGPAAPCSNGVGADALWSVWLEELGGKPPHPRLSKKRRSYLEQLAREQIRRRRNDHDALELMRNICRAVKRSDHHMSQRSFQLPESLFVNAERRERWVLEAIGASGPSPSNRTRQGGGREALPSGYDPDNIEAFTSDLE